MHNVAAFERAKLSLEGLSVGDAFGQKFFGDPSAVRAAIQQRLLPDTPWEFTDDTMMAIGIMQVLQEYGEINQDALAQTFARNYHTDPTRGYGGMAFLILAAISQGYDWREVSSAAFEGNGSLGNGGAMRVAPLGAYFADDLAMVVEQARLSAEVTHFHPEGQAGAIAVAVAAAYVASCRKPFDQSTGKAMLMTAMEYTPDGDTRKGLQRTLALPFTSSIAGAVSLLGNGSQVTAPDTVPFALWCAARHLDNFEDALWATVSGLGDRDTTCAMVGGIVALATGLEGIPAAWRQAREPLIGWQRIPVEWLFSRLSKIVQDYSKSTRKTIQIQIEGQEIELDKVLLDEIKTIMADLVRNTADHAIETPDIRIQQGKPPEAVIHLKAYYKEEKVYIELSHDGRGLDLQNFKSIVRDIGFPFVLLKDLEMRDEHEIPAWIAGQKKYFFGLHQWDFEIQTTPSQGTTFKFCAPRLIGDVTASEQRLLPDIQQMP